MTIELISTVLLENIILTRLKLGSELIDVVTRSCDSSYKTYVNHDKFHGCLGDIPSSHSGDAVICHAAMVRMVIECKQAEWSFAQLCQKKPVALAESINLNGIHPLEGTLESKFTEMILAETVGYESLSDQVLDLSKPVKFALGKMANLATYGFYSHAL